MKYNSASFAFDGGTIGFITEDIVSSVNPSYQNKKFGSYYFTDDQMIKDNEGKPVMSIAWEVQTRGDVIWFPYYSMSAINYRCENENPVAHNGVFLCVAKKKYGEIGSAIHVMMRRKATGGGTSDACFVAIIADHIENMPKTNNGSDGAGKWLGEYLSPDDDKTRSIELSIIVTNKYLSNENTWLGGARWRFFVGGGHSGSWKDSDEETTSHYAYRTAFITEIATNITEENADDTTPDASGSDFLLQNSEDERKYGINIYEISQPLIRFATKNALNVGTNDNAVDALKAYSRFMYSLLNSQVSTANYVLVSMPWLRPGFNCWVDPLYSDTVYYLSEVQQQGDPTSGATTVVSLIHGRPRGQFVSDTEAFGTMSDTSDNVFINTIDSKYRVKGSNGDGPWGSYLEAAEDFKNVKEATRDYYGHEVTETTPASSSQFHRSLYVDGVKQAPVGDDVNKSKVFNGEYTAAEIKNKIDAIYASAPDVVQERTKKLKTVVEGARKYIRLHYDSEKR